MEANDVLFDIKKTGRLLVKSEEKQYNNIYYCTNEDLAALVKRFDVSGKDILSVLGSGDQAFYFYVNGAKSVDLFDINKLTIYYYYLRLWVIKYIGDYYPDIEFSTYIEDLLSIVKLESEDEEFALLYWKMFISNYSVDSMKALFNFNNSSMNYNRMEDVSELREKIQGKKPVFYNLDITEDVSRQVNKKYDVVYVSNIRNWINISGKSWEQYRNSLYYLLGDKGVILCSNVVSEGPYEKEDIIFRRNFIFKNLGREDTYALFKLSRPGYTYVKRR